MISSSRIIHINSKDRLTGSNEAFTYRFALSPDEDYTHACVLQASIPLSYYLVQATKNTFTLEENGIQTTVSIPVGNYNVNSFITVATAALNSAGNYTYSITMNNQYTNTNNGLFSFSVSGNAGIQPKFIFGSYLYEQFGFNSDSTNTFSGDGLVSVNVVNFINEQTLYLYSDLVETKQNNSTGVLQEIYSSNFVPYSCITYQCVDVSACSKKLSRTITNSFSIVLQNENTDVMNLNGRNMVLSLLLYKKDNIADLLRSYIKANLLSMAAF